MIGEDEDGNFYVMAGKAIKHSGPWSTESKARHEAKKVGLNGGIIQVAGRPTVIESAAAVMEHVLSDEPEIESVFFVATATFAVSDPNDHVLEDERKMRIAKPLIDGLLDEVEPEVIDVADLVSVLDQRASMAIEDIGLADYSDLERAGLIEYEKFGKGRKTVLRALGVDV